MSEMITPILIAIVVAVLLFLVLREVFCWYNKVNERIANQKEIISLLRRIIDRLPVKELTHTKSEENSKSGTSSNDKVGKGQ
jgi:hypothetical protein